MMFETVKPEQVGVSSRWIRRYVELLESHSLSTHDVIMVRHNRIFYEACWKPFHKDFLHRMYSVTKSFVSLAVGCLVQEGRLELDAPAVSYLPPEVSANAFDSVKEQTVRDMLRMATGRGLLAPTWFEAKPADRLQYYFDSASEACGEVSRVPGTVFEYDSSGSFVLGAIVERITGKPFLDYLREKFLDQIGFSKEAYCLKCPGGHSWGDSALLCKPEDLARVVNFVMHLGSWDGQQLMDPEYLRAAISDQICSQDTTGFGDDTYGYGYQIWQNRNHSFSFNGMGCQFGIAVPEKDLVFVYNGDNQGSPNSHVIMDRFFEEIADRIQSEVLPENPEAFEALAGYTDGLTLFALSDTAGKTCMEKINGREYEMEPNPMGITRMCFCFRQEEGELRYTNGQGDKVLSFGMGKNVFGRFPQEGYADLCGTVSAPGNRYRCAASAAWTHPASLSLLVQILDKYFGRLSIRAAFLEDGRISVSMHKEAEDFLQEYMGYARGRQLPERPVPAPEIC